MKVSERRVSSPKRSAVAGGRRSEFMVERHIVHVLVSDIVRPEPGVPVLAFGVGHDVVVPPLSSKVAQGWRAVRSAFKV